jgi:hypothetical protein
LTTGISSLHRNFRMFDISVRRDDSRRHRLTPIGIQLDARRKSFLGRSINVRFEDNFSIIEARFK